MIRPFFFVATGELIVTAMALPLTQRVGTGHAARTTAVGRLIGFTLSGPAVLAIIYVTIFSP